MVAGILGSLFGIGGGIIFVPVLTIAYDLGPVNAAALSLVGIVAISSWGAAMYMEIGLPNVRIGLMMELGAVTGAMIGALAAAYLEDWLLMLIFSVVMVFSAYRMMFSKGEERPDCSAEKEFEYTSPKTGEVVCYGVENRVGGTVGSVMAGAVSSLTGVGGGVIKVPIMNLYMKMPVRVATATSSYTLGITAFGGAIVYLLMGSVPIEMAAFLVIGSITGSYLGVIVSERLDASSLRRYFSIVLVISAALVLLQAGGII